MKRSQEASNGEMVAVWLDDKDETTLKYFSKKIIASAFSLPTPTWAPFMLIILKVCASWAKFVMVIRQFSGNVL